MNKKRVFYAIHKNTHITYILFTQLILPTYYLHRSYFLNFIYITRVLKFIF